MQSKNLKADNYFNDNRSNLQMFIEKFLVGGSQKRQGFFFLKKSWKTCYFMSLQVLFKLGQRVVTTVLY